MKSEGDGWSTAMSSGRMYGVGEGMVDSRLPSVRKY